MVKFMDLKSQLNSIRDEVIPAINHVIENVEFIKGPAVGEFENRFAAYIGAAACIGVANGTDALEIAIESLELPKGSEILVPANSFIASSEAVTRCGHRVVFCDVDDVTYNISLKDVKKRLTSKTRAIIAVHLYGHPCEMDSLCSFAEANGLFIVEDCAQAHGAYYKGLHVGNFGIVSAFSFYPGKNLGAYGDAGGIVTNNANIANKCRMIANHGRIAKYDHEFEGRNSRLDTLQAAVLNVKLKHLALWIERRRKIADVYRNGLHDIGGLILPSEAPGVSHAYHLFVIRTDFRDELASHLKLKGIETGIHYPTALSKLAAYNYLNQGGEDTFCNKSDRELLSLPMGEHLSDEQVLDVVASVRSFFS